VYIKKISEKFDKVFKCDDFSSVSQRLGGNSLFKSGNELYIIRDDYSLITNEPLWKNLVDRLKKDSVFLILKYGSLDQRTKFYKEFSEYAVQFDFMQRDVLVKHIKKKLDVSDNCCDYLISICGSNYYRILLEIDKIKHAAEFYKLSDMDCFKMCYNAGVFYEPPEDVVYTLIESILRHDVKNAYALLEESKRRADNPIMILSLLHTNTKQALQVKEIGETKDKSASTGLTPFQIKNSIKYTTCNTSKDLIRIIKTVKYCDKCIKDGTLQSDNVLDYLLVNVL
jgi:DNA polymerase III delta subunit